MKLGFTGTQNGMTPKQLQAATAIIVKINLETPITRANFGDCIGADEQFWNLINAADKDSNPRKICRVGHIPDNDSKRAFCQYDETRDPKPYLVRNRAIVDESNVIIAAPKEIQEELRSGTWATVRYAEKQGKRVIIVYPDGTTNE